MRSINKVIIIGNLTRDPEMRETPNGQSVVTFGVATNREWVTRDGERKNSAEFHECVAWANLAEICSKLLKKGHLVYIEGYLKTRSWDSPEGVKKFKTEIVVQDMVMLEKKKNGDDSDFIPEGNDEMDIDDETSENKPTEPIEEEKSETEEANTEEAKTPETEKPKNEEATEEKNEEKSEENPIDKDLGL